MGEKRNYREQLEEAKEELVRLKFEIQGLKDGMEERINQARQQERAKIAGEILAGKGE